MVERRYLPMSDGWQDEAPGTLMWLQAWYATQCDGDWEHASGVSIETLDNPGWSVRIDVSGTQAEDLPLEELETNRSAHDWLVVRKVENSFDAACGPLNLGDVLHAFRLWVEGPPAIADA
ncbi:immunity 53 family protein [Aquipuribacter sp. MA13-6]|uniref:immunity 53 family protein n=1 Tax=unclassified Aquipuribacter TaxID=2635084 RepID=UPI003EEB04D9